MVYNLEALDIGLPLQHRTYILGVLYGIRTISSINTTQICLNLKTTTNHQNSKNLSLSIASHKNDLVPKPFYTYLKEYNKTTFNIVQTIMISHKSLLQRVAVDTVMSSPPPFAQRMKISHP